MVRNTQGGSKTKSQGRKFSSNYASRHAIRLSESPLELYACVVKVYGNGRCLVHSLCDKELQCVIRNKFRGRSKRNNIVAMGTILLVGLREWEGPDNFKNSDVLEVYDSEDVLHLRSIPSLNIQRLDSFSQSHNHSLHNIDSFSFTEDASTIMDADIGTLPLHDTKTLIETDADIDIDIDIDTI